MKLYTPTSVAGSELRRPVATERLRAKARRVRALVVKETRQVLRDPSSVAIGIVLPVILILLFGFGLSLDVKNVPLAIVLEDSSYEARELVGSFELSAYFHPRITSSMPAAQALMIHGRVDGIVRASNLDLRAAVLRISESRAERDVSAASFWPTLSANASYTRQRISEATPNGAVFTQFNNVKIPGASAFSFPNPYSQYQLGLGASWEPDLFGRMRRSVEAASADLGASVEDQRAVLVSLDSDVARAYIDLRGAQLRKSVTEASLATQNEVLDLTRQRQAVGLTTDLDVENAAAEVNTTQAQLPLLDLQITQDINLLSKLMGREPEALRGELDEARPVPPVPPQIPIGLPADLARHRPDIREAEQKLHAATARIGVAVADLFPRLTLSAQGGVQSQSTSNLLEWASRFGSIGPTLELPIFDGSRWATIRVQDVREKEAALDYERTVLSALHEVENALAAYRADQDRRAQLSAAVAHSRDALTLARQRYESGVANFIVVLDAERTLQQNELSLAESVAGVSTDLVALYRALGGSAPTDADQG